MLIALIVLFFMAAALFIIAYRRGDNSHVKGLTVGKKMFTGLIPMLIMAFLVAGLIQVAIPPEVIRSWLGEEAGLRGILIGTLAGALIPGGPYVSFPIIAAIYKAGAGTGTAVAIITGWAMLGVGQLPFELALIGPRFMMVRLCSVFVVPPVAGIAAQYIFGGGF
ncbi:MAG: hypothetical protein FH756_15195 [Firmicutes bacterium]|nr:hypothetical protein [Bacillota bacterium]